MPEGNEEDAPLEYERCPDCNRITHPAWAYCPRCGHPLDESLVEDTPLRADGGRALQHDASSSFSVLDATAGGKHMWHDEMKEADHVVFADRREVDGLDLQPGWECAPDVLCDFRQLPFGDDSFDLICFDPPHRVNEDGMEQLTGVVLRKYGALRAETWHSDLRDAFDELWRVLRPGGTLTFKWADETKSHDAVLGQLEQTPLFGVTTERDRALVYKSAHVVDDLIPGWRSGGTDRPDCVQLAWTNVIDEATVYSGGEA